MNIIEKIQEYIKSCIIKMAMKKQMKKGKDERTENEKARQELLKKFKTLAYFVDWTDKQLSNRKERKRFWGEFTESKQIRKEYFDKFLAQFEKEQK